MRKRSSRGKDEHTKRRRKRNLSFRYSRRACTEINCLFRNRGKSYDSGLHSDSEMSDSSSVNGELSDEEGIHPLKNGFHESNGFAKTTQKRKNGMLNGHASDHFPPKSPRRASVAPAALHDEKVYNFCRLLIRRMGRGKISADIYSLTYNFRSIYVL